VLTVYGRTVPARLCAKAVTVVVFKGAEETTPANRIPGKHTNEVVQIGAHADRKLETAAVADRGTPAQWISGQQASPLVQSDVRGHCKGLVRQFRGDARTSKQKSRLQRRCHCNHCTCSSTSRSANFAHDDRIYCRALTRCSLMLLRGVELANPVL